MKSKYIMIMVALMAFLAIVMPVSAATTIAGKYINAGATVFVGEEGLDITNAMNGYSTLGFWESGASAGSAPYPIHVGSASLGNFAISSAQFNGRTGAWYQVADDGMTKGAVAFYVESPTLAVSVKGTDGEDLNGKTITAGTPVTFEVKTNVVLGSDSKRSSNSNGMGGPDTTGYIDIVVKSDGGATYSELKALNNDVAVNLPVSLQKLSISNYQQFWRDGVKYEWSTGNMTGGQRTYQNGNYTISVKFDLNSMTMTSETSSIKLGSDSLKIESNKDSVVRGKPFSVTISGKANTQYMLYLKGVSVSSAIAPVISTGQEGVSGDISGKYGKYITTGSSGTRTVEFTTSSNTKDQKYTVRAELNSQKYDEVAVSVVKGGMTLVADGDQTYYLGEEIKLSGTNSESYTTYFFLIGPNLNSNGVKLDEPSVHVDVSDESTFVNTEVDSDYTYSYKWSTAALDMDAGTYTIYAVSQPVDKSDLSNVAYATTSIVIKKPFVSAHASQSTVAKGDKVFIEGVAEGNPSTGVAIWVLGKNYDTRQSESVESDGTFKYEISGATTGTMSSGQYFIVVQHPMQNGVFDIDQRGEDVVNLELNDADSNGEGTVIFHLEGSGSLQGSDAAEALVQAINDPNIDDTYTKLNILVEEPVIAIDAIGDKQVGDKFTVTGKTNLAVDDEILVEMYSSSFAPTQKSQSGEFSGTTQTVKVIKSDAGLNTFSLDVDASTFKPDEYIVLAEGIVVDATGTTLFNVLDYQPTPVPTSVPTTVATVATIPPTVPPTEIPTVVPTETTKSPGFGAILALAGLMAVGFIVMRRH